MEHLPGKGRFSKSGHYNGLLLDKPYLRPENHGIKNTGTNRLWSLFLNKMFQDYSVPFPEDKLYICTKGEWVTSTNFILKASSFTNTVNLYQIVWVRGVVSEDWAFCRATTGNGIWVLESQNWRDCMLWIID